MVYAEPRILPIKGDSQNSLGFYDTTNHLISARRSDLVIIKKTKKKTCRLVNFAILADDRKDFFTPALADGFSPEFEWQQVSSSFPDSSLYSGQSQ